MPKINWNAKGKRAARSGKYATAVDGWNMGERKPLSEASWQAFKAGFEEAFDLASLRRRTQTRTGKRRNPVIPFVAGVSPAVVKKVQAALRSQGVKATSQSYLGRRSGRPTLYIDSKDTAKAERVYRGMRNPGDVRFKLIVGRRFKYEDGTPGQEFRWTDLQGNGHGSFDLSRDNKAVVTKGDKPPQGVLTGAMTVLKEKG